MNLKFHDVIKCNCTKQEIDFSGNEIWSVYVKINAIMVYVRVQKKYFYQKLLPNKFQDLSCLYEMLCKTKSVEAFMLILTYVMV